MLLLIGFVIGIRISRAKLHKILRLHNGHIGETFLLRLRLQDSNNKKTET